MNTTRSEKKFLRYFRKGFQDLKYIDWERNYKWQAHLKWEELLSKKEFRKLLSEKNYAEIAKRAAAIESKTNLLFSFEKMALRDAIRTEEGAKMFALGLYKYIYGSGSFQKRFQAFADTLAHLPRKQTRVLTWPLQTVFGFIANPEEHIFVKPRVTQIAAHKYGYDFNYKSKPNWETYKSMLEFAEKIRKDVKHLKPRDMIDVQSYMWVQGSDEYPEK
ncbi:MAG: hypothetical protein JWN78_3136 [Bacteroidota bacterium]|nr:hypothetical protein [Bacteroidota bacterium]